MLSLTNQIPAESPLIRLPMDLPAFMGILAFFTAVALLCLAFLVYLYALSRKQRHSQHAFDHTVDSEWALWSSFQSLRAAQNQPGQHQTMQAKCPPSGNAPKVKYLGPVPLQVWFMPKHFLGSPPTVLGTFLHQRPTTHLLTCWGTEKRPAFKVRLFIPSALEEQWVETMTVWCWSIDLRAQFAFFLPQKCHMPPGKFGSWQATIKHLTQLDMLHYGFLPLILNSRLGNPISIELPQTSKIECWGEKFSLTPWQWPWPGSILQAEPEGQRHTENLPGNCSPFPEWNSHSGPWSEDCSLCVCLNSHLPFTWLGPLIKLLVRLPCIRSFCLC